METELVINPTQGTETFQNCGLFEEIILPPEFSRVTWAPTPTPKVGVWLCYPHGGRNSPFENLSPRSDRLRWSESQVVEFCKCHRDKIDSALGNLFGLDFRINLGRACAKVSINQNGNLKLVVELHNHHMDLAHSILNFCGDNYLIVFKLKLE